VLHERFGHVNMAALQNLTREELVHGLPEIGQMEQLCEACKAGKQLVAGVYIDDLITGSDCDDTKSFKEEMTPMEARLKLSKQSTQPLMDATAYRSIVRSLRYLVNTRSDLAFVVGYVSCFLEEPREDHPVAVKRILYYMAGTSN
jgi:hypothetical protein